MRQAPGIDVNLNTFVCDDELFLYHGDSNVLHIYEGE